ncbi:MAG: 1-deoxy-D-xylulose-5-phosphate reductoisomerase [Phycisphaerales bacterium]
MSHSPDTLLTRRIIILGSTGSIGTQALEVIAHVNDLAKIKKSPIRFEVVGLAAKKNAHLLAEQARRFNVRNVSLTSVEATLDSNALPPSCKCYFGSNAAESLVRNVDCDIVLAAMVGSAGIPATLAAIESNKPVALANKETLVAAGAIVAEALSVRRGRSAIFPVDSEHAGLWQCVTDTTIIADDSETTTDICKSVQQLIAWAPPFVRTETVRKAILTASGGPFRTWPKDKIESATPEQAQNHPTWNMGAKVTIDSASLMNKALELIEAHWLFGLPAKKLDVLIHPQSIVHAIAEFADGSSIAQLAPPDMKLPIQRAICWPLTLDGASRRMSWSQMKSLEFETPDLTRFPALGLAYKVLELGGNAGATFNAANEEAVAAFLARKISFGAIPRVVEAALDDCTHGPVNTLDDVWRAESAAREFVKERISRGKAM